MLIKINIKLYYILKIINKNNELNSILQMIRLYIIIYILYYKINIKNIYFIEPRNK